MAINNFFRVFVIGIILILFVSNTSAATLTVCPTGCTYSSIQTAINAASPDDTIEVQSGTYYEQVVVDKTLKLQGENRDTTIIDGGGGQIIVVEVKANNSVVSGFTLRNGWYGVRLGEYRQNNVITDNIASGMAGDGMTLAFGSHHNIVSNNILNSNAYDGLFVVYSSNYNTISGNTVNGNGYYGLLIHQSHYNTIKDNNITSNALSGINMHEGSSNNIVYNNNLINNVNAADSGINFWDNGIIGNHWSNFDEPSEGCNDVNNNGICDLSLSIGASIDHYPKVSWDITNPEISIVNPIGGQTFSTDTITVDGTASDNIGLNKVEVKVGAGSWELASGTTSWSKIITLSQGSNIIYARATDTSGNTNETLVTVNYEIPNIPPIITFLVTDNETGRPIKDAIVQLSSSYRGKTNETGGITFTVSYEYLVKKGRYFDASGAINIARDIIVEVKLIPRR